MAGSDLGVLVASDPIDNELYHHGTKGQKWGHRKYQNKDGSLTEEGRKHYGVGAPREIGKKIATVVRKKIKPTTEDLLEKKKKAEEKARQRELKEEIKDLNKPNRGKKINELSDDELRQKMERLALEKQYKEVEKSSKTSKGKEAFKNAMKRAATRAAANALETGINALAEKVASDITMSNRDKLGEDEAGLKRTILNSKNAKDAAEAAKKLQAFYKATKRDNGGDKKPSGDRLRDAENELKLKALSGDKDAQQQLVDYRKANDPFKKPRQDGGGGGGNPNKPSGGSNGGNGGNPNKPSVGGNGGNGSNPKDYEQSLKDRRARIAERQKSRDEDNKVLNEIKERKAAREKAAKEAQREEARQQVRDELEEATKQAKKHTDDIADLLRRASDAAKKGKRNLQDQMDDNIPEAVKQYQKSVNGLPGGNDSTDSGKKQVDSHKDDPVPKKSSPPDGFKIWDDYLDELLFGS